MARKRRRHKEYSNLKVLDISSDGLGVAKQDEKVIFIENTMPGDVVDVRTYQRRKSFEKARVLKFNEASENRQAPFCNHFNDCGGCKWQYIPYKEQLEYKDNIVKAAFDRLAKVKIKERFPILGCASSTYYRNKMEYTFSCSKWLTDEEIQSGKKIDQRALGLHVPGNYAKIVDLDTCYLQSDLSNKIRNSVKAFALAEDISFYNIRERSGFLRNLIIRNNRAGDYMVILVVGIEDTQLSKKVLEHIHQGFPEVKSLHYIVNTKLNDSYADLNTQRYFGEEFLLEQLGDYKFKIRPKSFFQTNTLQAEMLYNVVKDFADLKGDETLYDLYSGVGSIGIYLSQRCKKVVGIEQIDQAVEDAKENALLNNVENANFSLGDVKDLLDEGFISTFGRADILITDPPRAGMHPDVVESILKAEIPKLIYVSCNPSTQARDIALLDSKYAVLKSRAVDMFPQTTHIENVCLLALKG